MAVSHTCGCKIVLIEQDITQLNVDAIVNFELCRNLIGGPLHKHLQNVAGPGLKVERKARLNGRMLADGDVLLTGAHNIYHAKGIIHAVVPVALFSFSEKDGDKLALCHERALDLARANDLRTIAFPCMYKLYSCKQASVDVALDAIDTILFCSVDKADTDAYRAALPKYFPDFEDVARLPRLQAHAYVIDCATVVEVGQYVYFGKEIGKGAFSAVFKGRHKQTRSDVAIKVINGNGHDDKHIATEVDILKNVSGSSKHLVSLYDVRQAATETIIVMELCNAGDLRAYLKSRPERRLDEDEIRHFLRHIVSAIKGLHETNVIHRDLKPQNMLLHRRELLEGVPSTFDLTLKIADFGVSRYSFGGRNGTVIGTPVYMAPELLQAYLNRGHAQYTASVDLWSIGVILYECLTGERPFQGQDLENLCNRITGLRSRFLDVPISFPQMAPRSLKKLIKGLLQPRPQRRMGFDDFFSNKFCMESANDSALSHERWNSMQDTASADSLGVKKTISNIYLRH